MNVFDQRVLTNNICSQKIQMRLRGDTARDANIQRLATDSPSITTQIQNILPQSY